MPYLLRRWWVGKYSLPPTSKAYLRYTAEEMLVEFFEDYFESHPERQLRRELHEETGVQYVVTGDPIVDCWEREIAAGREPDFNEGLTEEARSREVAREEQARGVADFGGFEERFDVDA